MKAVVTGTAELLEAISEAQKAIQMGREDSLVVITRSVHEANMPVYDVYVASGSLVNGQIVES